MHGLCGEPSRRRRQLLLRRLRRFLLIPRVLRLPNAPSSGPLPFVRNFPTKEIKRATSGFSTIIRRDSHGTVYRARFSDGFVAAVREVRTFQQDNNTFYKEVQLLGRLHHRHLVKLRGFSEGPEHDRFLVYDYMENGSLKDCLHDPLRTPLNWRTRLQIAINIAAALEYLHFFCDPPVYNISIDSTNVFLDENFVAKLCDVGLLGCDDNLIPEPDNTCSRDFTRRRHVIFQFGVLILELITGQSFESEGAELISWVQNSNFTCSMHQMVDADLGNSYDSKELRCLLTIARFCTKTGDKPIISIRQILRYLQRKIEPESYVS